MRLLILAWILTVLTVGQAQAGCGHSKEHSGYCPAGTCAKGGDTWACNLAKCSAANCKK